MKPKFKLGPFKNLIALLESDCHYEDNEINLVKEEVERCKIALEEICKEPEIDLDQDPPLYDLSSLSTEDKTKMIEGFLEKTGKYSLMLFMQLGLQTHMEGTIFNQATNEYFQYSFRKKIEPSPDPLERMKPEKAERFDAEEFLNGKDIFNHPQVTDRTNANSYEVADLMADFANHYGKPEIKFPTEEDLKTFLKNCDPLNQTLEKQADIRFGYLTAIRQLKHLNNK